MSGSGGFTWVVAASLLAAATAGAVLPPGSSARLARLGSLGRPDQQINRRASRRAVRRGGARRGARRGPRGAPKPAPVPEPILLDLVAAALEAGLPTSRAVVVVQSAVDLVSATSGPADPAGSGPDWSGPGTDLADALDLAEATGAGPAPLVRRAASRRRQARTAAQVAAARRMGVLLVLPTGLCFLPAFVALGVVPVILDLLAN